MCFYTLVHLHSAGVAIHHWATPSFEELGPEDLRSCVVSVSKDAFRVATLKEQAPIIPLLTPSRYYTLENFRYTQGAVRPLCKHCSIIQLFKLFAVGLIGGNGKNKLKRKSKFRNIEVRLCWWSFLWLIKFTKNLGGPNKCSGLESWSGILKSRSRNKVSALEATT